jgi:autotransporter-associated beta strand protein
MSRPISFFARRALLSLLIFPALLNAGTKRFSFSAGSTVIWGTVNNWSPSNEPAPSDDAVFDYTNEAGTKTILAGLNAASKVANSLTFGGSITHGAESTFTLRANTSSSSTARTLSLGTSGQAGAGSITVDSSVTGTQSVGTESSLWGTMNITLASGVSGFTVVNNSTSQTLDLSANLIEGATAGSTLSLSSAGGQVILSGASSYTGTTTITAGTLKLDSAGTTTSRLGATTSITVNSGGALLLANSLTPTPSTNRINNAAAIKLAGGTLDLGGLSEGAAGTTGVGALTLSGTSKIDFGVLGTNNLIQFSGLGTHTGGTILQILEWEGTAGIASGKDRLLFAGTSGAFTALYAQNDITFNGASGYGVLDFGSFYEVYELVPVPEPATWIAAAFAAAVIGYHIARRRHRAVIC